MRRWLAIGAVVGFSAAVLGIAVLGGPGEEPATPTVPAAPDAGPVVIPAAANLDLPAIPNAAQRRLGAMGPAQLMERPKPALLTPGEGAVQPDAGG
jgi:hypothetical protein